MADVKREDEACEPRPTMVRSGDSVRASGVPTFGDASIDVAEYARSLNELRDREIDARLLMHFRRVAERCGTRAGLRLVFSEIVAAIEESSK